MVGWMTRNADEKVMATPMAAESELAGVPVRGRANGALRSRRVKSEITQMKLRRATARLLEQKSLRDLKVSDITSLASVSPSTFYIYFADVDEAVLAVLDDVYKLLPDFAGMVARFSRETLRADIRAYVKAYLTFSDEHYAVLRLRNLAADEGDSRFRKSRSFALRPMLEALGQKIEELRGADAEEAAVPARALALVMIGSMERLAAIIRLRPPGRDVVRGRLVDAAVQLFCDGMQTPRPFLVQVKSLEPDKKVLSSKG